jgi:large subunit ribosomal protein L25
MVNRLNVKKRETSTNSELKQLRSSGKIPAVVYGESINNASIAVEEKELIAILKSNPNAIVQMDLPDQGKHPVMLGEMQRDPLTRSILHIDFQQINVKNPIKASVRIDVSGKAKGVEEGGILQTRLNELDIQCLPHLIPSSVTADVSELNIGDSILVSDLQIPAEVEVLSDANEVVVSILVPQKPADDEETEGAEAEKAEVEVIGEKEEA